jgi:hypothetical protein
MRRFGEFSPPPCVFTSGLKSVLNFTAVGVITNSNLARSSINLLVITPTKGES